jgi:hypothetical protein
LSAFCFGSKEVFFLLFFITLRWTLLIPKQRSILVWRN